MEKYHVPPDLEVKLQKEGAELKKTGELKKITVLSVDMRGFSPIVQKYNELVKMVETLQSALTNAPPAARQPARSGTR